MAETKTCPKCGAELPANAPSGICPKCLMRAGLEITAESHEPARSGDFAATTPQARQFVPPEPNSLAPHFPQLEIRELLGQGGMGAVYKAQQTKLDRLVALKIIRPESADDPAFAERFNREARTLARLNHPNIVAVHDFGEVTISMTDGDDSATRPLYYFLMEYVDGANLRQLLQGGELKAEQALTIVPQICEALQFAHDEGIVHRDIKPENILVDSKGRVKIADFGLAKLLGTTSGEDHTLTGTHQVMGTPRYMAPEQMEALRSVDHRADIYSLGVVFYEMLTGELPMGSFEPPSKKVQVDVRLDEVVLHSLAKEPERRYQHASDIKTDVESILATGRGFRSAGAGFGTGLQHEAPAAIGLSATEQEAKNADGLLTAVLFILFFGSVGGGWLMFMPWSQVHIETLPEASQQGLRTGISHQLEAEGYRSALPILGTTLSLVLCPAITLRWAAWSSPLTIPALIAMNIGYSSAHSSVSTVLLVVMVLQIIHALLFVPLILFGAARMQSLRSRGWAKAASIAAMLPLGLTFVVGIPAGIWSLVVLTREEVAIAFDKHEKAKKGVERTAADRVKWPAVGLIFAGLSGCALAVTMFVLLASGMKLVQWAESAGAIAPFMFVILWVPMLLAGVFMMRLQAYHFVFAWTVLAIVFSPINLLSLPFGIWALTVLMQPDVKDAFGIK